MYHTRNKEINKTWLHGIYAKKFLFDCDSNKLSISLLKRMGFFLQHTSELLENKLDKCNLMLLHETK